MSEPPRARYLTTNWKTCNAALAHRGSLQIRFDPGMQWLSAPTGKRGRQPVFPDAAIQTCLTLKALFKLSLRQTTGMVASLLEMAGLDWPVPDFSTLIRRQKALLVEIPCQAGSGALHLLIDSTGIKAVGDGEWCAQTWSFQAPPVAQVPPGRRRPDTGDPGHRSYRQPDWRCPHAARIAGADCQGSTCRFGQRRCRPPALLSPRPQKIRRRRCREAGCSNEEGMAITGHKTER